MFAKLILRLFISIVLVVVATSADEDLKICLPKLGCLQGTTMKGYETDKFEAYLGIPYAKPPIDELRLKNPVPIEPWTDVLDATKLKEFCVQKNYFLKDWPVHGMEDCLYVNVYRPAERKDEPLPVLFYIHGGGFFSGAPHLFGASYLMDTQDVVLVTVAYRLGAFGFLSTEDENMPGNFGLKDQNLALKWVQENIAAFGGDPKSVTIFGHSAGSSSVHFHLLHEASHGLFHRGASFSGTALAPFVRIIDQPLLQTQRVAEHCRIADAATLSTAELAEKLRAVDMLTLVNAGDALKTWHIFPMPNFGPVFEEADWKDAFITQHTVEAQLTGKFVQVPWLISTEPKLGEGAIFTLGISECTQKTSELNANFDEKLGMLLSVPKADVPDIVNALVQEYMGGVHELNEETINGFSELFGDYYFMHALHKSMETFLEHGDAAKSPLYVVNFDYHGPYSWTQILHGGSKRDMGVAHMDDAIYLFDMPIVFPNGLEKGTTDAKLIKRFVDLLVDFAKTGKLQSPTGIGACTAEALKAGGDDAICDYLSFENDGDNYKEVIGNKFTVKAKDTWKKIFGF